MRLLPARHDDVGIAAGDLLHADRHRPQAGAAELVQAPGRLLLRHARLHRRLTRRILPFGRAEDLAEDHFVDFVGLDLGTFERALDGDGAELMSRQGAERAVEAADRRARRRDDDDVLIRHEALPFERPCSSRDPWKSVLGNSNPQEIRPWKIRSWKLRSWKLQASTAPPEFSSLLRDRRHSRARPETMDPRSGDLD